MEADLILEKGLEREVIEIKLTSAPAPQDLARLSAVASLIKATHQALICRVRQPVFAGDRWVTNLGHYLAAARRDKTGK